MKKFLFQSSVLLTLFILKYSIAQTHNTPPVLVAVPRTIQLPVNTKVGTVVCRVKATDHDGDEVEFALTPNPVSPYSRLPFRDGSEFFRISKRGSEAVITLSVTLVDKVKVGDQLSLSVTGLDDVSGISTRTEIPIFIEDAIADYDDEPTMTSSVSNAPLPDSSTQATPTPTVSTVETSPSKSSTSPMPSTSVPEQGSGQISEGLSEEEEAAQRSKMYIMILVPIFVVCPALGVAVFLFRSKIARWVKRHCGRSEDSDDCEIKDVTKIENAESEFFKMAPDMRKISSNSYGFSPKSGEMNKLSMLSDEDPWEFPRHQLKVLSRLGEGSFGQVWMYEADGIDRKRG